MKKNKLYMCYLKSHCDAPDYEQEIEAKSKKEAVDMLMPDLGRHGWERPEVEERVCLMKG